MLRVNTYVDFLFKGKPEDEKKEEEAEDLSEEDKILKEELELCVTRLGRELLILIEVSEKVSIHLSSKSVFVWPFKYQL